MAKATTVAGSKTGKILLRDIISVLGKVSFGFMA
jgi:hypothetical protein